jgi:hypothetical protein
MRFLLFLALSLLLLAGSWQTLADETIWMPYAGLFEPDEGTVKFGLSRGLIFGEPDLGQWVIDQADNVDSLDTAKLRIWVLAAGMYRISEVEPVVFRLVEKHLETIEKPLQENQLPPKATKQLFQTLAVIAQPASKKKLQTLMDRQLTHPQADKRGAADAKYKTFIAAALVRMDEDKARERLYGFYRQHVDPAGEDGRPKDAYYAYQMLSQGLYDKTLFRGVSRLATPARMKEAHSRDALELTLKQMEITRSSLRQIRAMVYERNPDPMKRYPRMFALAALAELGTVEDIERIRKIELYGNERDDKYITTARDHAIMILGSRLWRE